MAFVADCCGQADSPDLVIVDTLFQHHVNAESSFLMLMACFAHSKTLDIQRSCNALQPVQP